jgi:hypothetical protein
LLVGPSARILACLFHVFDYYESGIGVSETRKVLGEVNHDEMKSSGQSPALIHGALVSGCVRAGGTWLSVAANPSQPALTCLSASALLVRSTGRRVGKGIDRLPVQSLISPSSCSTWHKAAAGWLQ